jgi:tetratricopeptide (TPR) repeat protein
MRATKEESAWIAKFMEAIDAGRFAEADRLLPHLKMNADPLVAILEAEVDLYFGRLEPARERLAQIDPWRLSARSLPRYLLALGQCYVEHGQWELAEEILEGACCLYKLLHTRCHLARGLYHLGMVKFKRGNGEEAEALWEQARACLAEEETARGDFALGVLEYALGVRRFQTGRMEEARASLQASVRLLDEEHGRYYACALGALGAVLVSCGECADAVEKLQEAQRILIRYAIGDPLIEVTATLAAALVRMERFDEAEHAVRESLEALQRFGHERGVGRMFKMLAEISFERNDVARTEHSARMAIEYAEALGDDLLRAEAQLLLGRAAARRRDHEAAERALSHAREIARCVNDRKLEGLACLYWAEACYATSPMHAQELIARAQELLRPLSDPQIEREIERVSQRATSERIRLTPDNKLIFDGNFLPNWYVARETLERFLLKNALRQAGGNLTKAGELLGITKVHVHNLRRQFNL